MPHDVAQILMLAQPRSGCHLLERILHRQSGVTYLGDECLVPGVVAQAQWLCDNDSMHCNPSAQKTTAYESAVGHASAVWREALDVANQADKKLFFLTHPHFGIKVDKAHELLRLKAAAPVQAENVTLYPDDVLFRPGTIPILNIRHPSLLVPSVVRGGKKNSGPFGNGLAWYYVGSSPLWTRCLYEEYQRRGFKPLIVDADDYMTSEDFSRHLCTLAGLNPDEAIFQWDKTTPEDQAKMNPILRSVQQHLIDSSGLDNTRAACNIDLDAEHDKWASEFGDGPDGAPLVEELVELALPHYEWLYERRVRLPE